MKNKKSYMIHIVSLVLTLIVLYLSREGYTDVHGMKDIRYFNFVVIGLLFFLTFRSIISKLSEKIYPPPVYASPLSSPRQEKMVNMEFLRVLFTTEILLFHFTRNFGNWNTGWWAIVPFFIMSGFFLAMTFSPKRSLPSFAKRKLIQFVPLIIFACLAEALFLPSFNVKNFFSSVFLLSGTGYFPRSTYCAVSWYVSILFWVSLFYFYLMKTKSRETVNITLALIVFFGGIALTKIGPIPGAFLGGVGDIGNVVDMQIVLGLTIVAVGYFLCMFYIHVKEKIRLTISNRIIYTVLELVFLFYSLGLMHIKTLNLNNLCIHTFSFSCLILLFALKVGYISRFLEQKIWVVLGKYSLATYLMQLIIVRRIFPILFRQHKDYMMNHEIMIIIITLIACWILGVWAHYVIEKPATRYLRNNFGK